MERVKHLKQIGANKQKILKQMRNGGKDMKVNSGINMKKQLTNRQINSQKIEDFQRNEKNLN